MEDRERKKDKATLLSDDFQASMFIDERQGKLVFIITSPESSECTEEMIKELGLKLLSNMKFCWSGKQLEIIITSGIWRSQEKKISKEKFQGMNFSGCSVIVPLPTPKKMITLELWDCDNNKNILCESFPTPDLDELWTLCNEGTNIPVENSDEEDNNNIRSTIDDTQIHGTESLAQDISYV